MAQLIRGFGHEAGETGFAGLTPARSVARRVTEWLSERRLRARTMRELSQLQPRDLQDLSITPTDFPSIANGTWKRS